MPNLLSLRCWVLQSQSTTIWFSDLGSFQQSKATISTPWFSKEGMYVVVHNHHRWSRKRFPNLDLDNWNRDDQLLLSWLLSTLTTLILHNMTRITTSKGVWVALEKLFAVKSKARLIPLRVQLQTKRKAQCLLHTILWAIAYRWLEFKALRSPFRSFKEWHWHKKRGSNERTPRLWSIHCKQWLILQRIEMADLEDAEGTTPLSENAKGEKLQQCNGGRGNSKPTCQICEKQGYSAPNETQIKNFSNIRVFFNQVNRQFIT